MKPFGKLFGKKTVEAASQAPTTDGAIVSPRANDRFLETMQREYLPNETKAALDGALSGNLQQSGRLFNSMIDTWPRLSENLREVQSLVKKAPFTIEADDPDNSLAVEKAEFIEKALQDMRGNVVLGVDSFSGLIDSLVLGYYLGHTVNEIHFEETQEGVTPSGSKTLPWRYFGYPRSGVETDRLMLNRDGTSQIYEDFPEDRFLVAINRAHNGHASIAAPLRCLVSYWLGSTYGLKWLMQYGQLFGMPIRWAEYSEDGVKDKVAAMMRNFGSQSWGVFPIGTKLNIENSPTSTGTTPQETLQTIANEACDVFILGQTLTTGTQGSGSRALGEIHNSVRMDIANEVADFVADIINCQLIPALLRLNYGDAEDAPKVVMQYEKEKDVAAMVQRDKTLFAEMKLPVAQDYLYERYKVPKPEAGEDLFVVPHGVQGDPATGADNLPHETEANEQEEEVEAKKVEARFAATEGFDTLAGNIASDLTGLAPKYLQGVKPVFMELLALGEDDSISDEKLAEAVQDLTTRLPQLFDDLDTDVLQEALMRATGTAAILGASDKIDELDV